MRAIPSSALADHLHSSLSRDQLQIDGVLGSIERQALDSHTIAAMTLGSLGFSVTQALATPLFSTLFRAHSLVKASSWMTAFLGEVSIFRMANQAMDASHSQAWYNPQEFISTATDFLCLKGAGLFLGHQGFLLQQTSAVGGMVAGELLGESLNWREKSNESLAARSLRAFGTNIALGAGGHFAQQATGHRLSRVQTQMNRAVEFIQNSHLTTLRERSSISAFSAEISEEARLADAQAQSALRGLVIEGQTENYARYATDGRVSVTRRAQMLETLGDELRALLRLKSRPAPIVFLNFEKLVLEIFKNSETSADQRRSLWNLLLTSPYLEKIGEVFDHSDLQPSDRSALVQLIQERLRVLKPERIDPSSVVQLGDLSGDGCVHYLYRVAAKLFESPHLDDLGRTRLFNSIIEGIPHFDEAVHAAGKIICSERLHPNRVQSLREALEVDDSFQTLEQYNHVWKVEAHYNALRSAYAAGLFGEKAHQDLYRKLTARPAAKGAKLAPITVLNLAKDLEQIGLLLVSPHLRPDQIQTLRNRLNEMLQHAHEKVSSHAWGVFARLVRSRLMNADQEARIAEDLIAQVTARGEAALIDHSEWKVAAELFGREALPEDLRLRLIEAFSGSHGFKPDDASDRGTFYYDSYEGSIGFLAREELSPSICEALVDQAIRAIGDFRPTSADRSGDGRWSKRHSALNCLAGLISNPHFAAQRTRIFEAICLYLDTMPREALSNLSLWAFKSVSRCDTLSPDQMRAFAEKVRALVDHDDKYTRDAALEVCNALSDSPLLTEVEQGEIRDFVYERVMEGLSFVSDHTVYALAGKLERNPRLGAVQRKNLRVAILSMALHFNISRKEMRENRWPEPDSLMYRIAQIYSDPFLSGEEALELWTSLTGRMHLQGNFAARWDRVLDDLVARPQNALQLWLNNIMEVRLEALSGGARPRRSGIALNRRGVEGYATFWRMALRRSSWRQALPRLLPAVLRQFSQIDGNDAAAVALRAKVAGELLGSTTFENVESVQSFWTAFDSQEIPLPLKRAYVRALLKNISEPETRERLMLMNRSRRTPRPNRSQRAEVVNTQDAYRDLVAELRSFLRENR